jgi:hypothetical protein
MPERKPVELGKSAGGVALPPIVTHPVPLTYHRYPSSQMTRRAVVDTSVPPAQQRAHRSEQAARQDYWSPEIRQTHGKTGKPLKKPRVSPNPNVVDPHTVAFLDSHTPLPDEAYLDYVTTRSDQRGHGHARRLIEDFAIQYPEHSLDFGRVMHPAVWKLREELADRGRTVRGRRDF